MHIADVLATEAVVATQAAELRREPHQSFPILTAKLKLTWRCNLRCQMCGLWRRPEQFPDHCELPTALILDTLQRLRERGLRKINLSGGELLLHEGFRMVVQRASDLGLQVNLTTNGTLLSKETVRYLIDQRVHAVTISVDDASPRRHDALRGVSGAWKRTWKGFAALQECSTRKGRGPTLAINTVITRRNIDHLGALYELLRQRHVDRWRLLPVDTSNRTLRPTAAQWSRLAAQWDAWRPLLDRLPVAWQLNRPERSARRARQGRYAVDFYGERMCFAPWFNLFIDANGAVYPCCTGKGGLPAYGNLREQPLEAILASLTRREIQATMAADHPFPVCHTCDDFLEENAAFAEQGERPGVSHSLTTAEKPSR
jgi:radical SAM protein with 4Fe4S-binding SPASM domain